MSRVVRMVNPMAVKADSYSLELFNPEPFIRYLLSFIICFSKSMSSGCHIGI